MSDPNAVAEPAAPAAAIPFSLTRGGALHWVSRRVGIVPRWQPSVVLRMLFIIAVTWLPMAAFAAAQGVALGDRVTVPFLYDITVYTRFLLAVPLLIIVGPIIDERLQAAVNGFISTGIVPEDGRANFIATVRRLERIRDRIAPEVLILALAFLASWLARHSILDASISSWEVLGSGTGARVSLAGRWLNLVGMPIYSFLLLRWLWRIGIWTTFLYRVSKLDLKLVPTHPDRAGGLGFLGDIHCVFGNVVAPLTIAITGRGAFLVMYAGWNLDTLKSTLGILLAFGVVLAFGPLLVFTRSILLAKRRGIIEYGDLAAGYVRSFDRKWVRGETKESILGAADIQSLADIGTAFDVVRGMRPVPFTTGHLLAVLLSGALPMLPLIATVVPLRELLDRALILIGKG